MEELRAESLSEDEKVFYPAKLSENSRVWLKGVAVYGVEGMMLTANRAVGCLHKAVLC